MAEYKSIAKNLVRLGAEHIVETTALLAFVTPALAAWENVAAGVTDEASYDNRVLGAELFYLGAGIAFSKGRNLYYGTRNKLRHGLGLSERKPLFVIHDTAYTLLFGVPFNIGVSLCNGYPWEQARDVGIGNSFVGAFLGYGVGFVMDAARDLTGIEESKRLPLGIKKMSRVKKLALSGGLVAASLGATKGIYESTPEGFKGVIKMVMPEKERVAPESSLEKSLD